MPSEIKREISCFTAYFLDGKVTVGGETFPSGYFFVNAMNEYWKPYNGDDAEDFEIATKLAIVKLNRDKVREEISFNYLYPDHAEELYNDVQYYLKNIARAKPFCFLDMDAERERCRRIFGAENVAAIISYLRKRSFFNYEHDSGWEHHARQGERIYSVKGCSTTLSSTGGGLGGRTGIYLINKSIRKLTPRECARLMGFPNTFQIAKTDNQAYQQFGNSVVVDVLQYIMIEVIKTIEEANHE